MYVAGFDRGVRPIGDWSMSMTLSSCSSPFDRDRGRAGRRLCRPLRSRSQRPRPRMSLTSELLPEPLTPVTQTNTPSGISTSMSLRLWCACARRCVMLAFARSRRCLGRTAICLRAGEVLPGQAARVRLAMVATDALRDDLAAADAGAGAEVDDVVGGPHRVFVVLDDDDGVAHVAELARGCEQPVVVARMQADRRLVEDVEHADQPAADLAGQADALRLAAGERRGGAVERQVVQADVSRKPSRPRISLSSSSAMICCGGVEDEVAAEVAASSIVRHRLRAGEAHVVDASVAVAGFEWRRCDLAVASSCWCAGESSIAASCGRRARCGPAG